MPPRKSSKSSPTLPKAQSYSHKDADVAMRPDVGTQAQFRKMKGSKRYRYDSSVAPSMEWDGQNGARGLGEWLIAKIEEASSLPSPHAFPKPQEFLGNDGKVIMRVDGLHDAVAALKGLQRPFLNWSGKAERLSFDVPTLPLFVHDRLSTKAIIETLKSHRKDAGAEQTDIFDLFGDPQHPVHDQVLRAYEHRDAWTNRMILGDSLVVMNSLLEYEGLGGQVQMIYMDPPYGVKFGSNFQPFVRKRDVSHGDDDDMSREPEMVKAYRDTWELGLHSYLTYLRDRLKVARDLLTPSGSIFVQISDENLHHVREVMDEVFGAENFVSQIAFQTTSGFKTKTIATLGDHLLWYARTKETLRVRKLFERQPITPGEGNAKWIILPDGSYRGVTAEERRGERALPSNGRLYFPDNLQSQGAASTPQPWEYQGTIYNPGANSHWKPNYPDGLNRLAAAGRIHVALNSIRYRRFATDFPYQERGNIWTDTLTGNFTDEKIYVVQTNVKVVERCMLLCSDPGDLVLDPTCGSGTTAYVAEQWGRRWITTDVSRVPLALARQRLLSATYSWFDLKDESRGPGGGFSYQPEGSSRNPKSVGPGIVQHITLESIANNEPPKEEVLVDRPEEVSGVIRVTGQFTVEATIPTPVDWEGDGEEDSAAAPSEDHATFIARMIEVLRRSPVLQVGGGRTVTFENIRIPAKTLSLSAEAVVKNGEDKTVALVFGPSDGAVSEKLVYEAAREADLKSYRHLYVIGFAIQPNARGLVEKAHEIFKLGATYVQATPDILMGDLLKNMRSSQLFSVCGLPDIDLRRRSDGRFEVELLALDVFDPVTMETPPPMKGSDVPAWFLDTDYNGLCFHVSQAFFPRTSAWESLKKALKATHEESVWDHLAGTISAPFDAGDHKLIAVKVIDDRGNELVVTKKLSEAKKA